MAVFLKDSGVAVEGVHGDLIAPRLMFALGFVAAIYQQHGHDCVITSAADGHHNPGSLHPLGRALDIRTVNLDPAALKSVVADLQRSLGALGFDIILEGTAATAATTAAHLHIEYDPKGRAFWRPSK